MSYISSAPYTATDDGCGVTESSLATWAGTRAMFGAFVEVRLGTVTEAQGPAYLSVGQTPVFPTMVLVDAAGRTLALNGVTCGFEGTGPRGAATILAREGFLSEEEAAMVVSRVRGVLLRMVG